MYTIKCDTHTHTLYSRHAYSTIEENVRAAAERGMELLASTDHFSAMLYGSGIFSQQPSLPRSTDPAQGGVMPSDSRLSGSSGTAPKENDAAGAGRRQHGRELSETDGITPKGNVAASVDCYRNFQFFTNQGVWPRSWHGVTLLRGAEADIIDLEGHLFGHGIPISHGIVGQPFPETKDLDEKILGMMDYAIASVHGKDFAMDASTARVTEMYIRVLENPHVFILGHIGRSGLQFDVDEVLLRAKALNKLIEINEHSFAVSGSSRRRCRDIAERCAELGVGISLATDAHISCDIGSFPRSLAMLEELHFPEELIVSRDKAHFLDALRRSGVADFGELE